MPDNFAELLAMTRLALATTTPSRSPTPESRAGTSYKNSPSVPVGGLLMNLLEKRAVTFDDLEAQSAFELPKREMLLVTVVITNLLNNLTISIPVQNNNIAVQVCAIVEAINVELFDVNALDCDIEQKTSGNPNG
jgi:hypothetical protein